MSQQIHEFAFAVYYTQLYMYILLHIIIQIYHTDYVIFKQHKQIIILHNPGNLIFPSNPCITMYSHNHLVRSLFT
jgi:hypothetical protein